MAGQIPRNLVAGDYQEAKRVALEYQGIFGKDNYFIEIQDHGIPEQKRILPDLIRLSRETGIGLVATNDAHYIRKEDSQMQKVLVCIQTNHTVDEDSDMEFPTQEFYIKSRQEMEQLFPEIPEALDNTLAIAERCNVEFEFGHTKLPYYTAPDGRDNVEFFEDLCRTGLVNRYGANPAPELTQRLEHEMSVIKKMGYVDYSSSSGTSSTTPAARASQWDRAEAPVQGASPPTLWVSPASTPSSTTCCLSGF